MSSGRMNSFRGCLITFLVSFVFLEPASAAAQTRPPTLQKLVEEAKKEGTLKLQWLGGRLDGDAGLRPMVAALNKMYGTNLKLQYTPGPDFPTQLNKITQEKAAGVPSSTDINLMTSNHVVEGTKKGVLKKMWVTSPRRRLPGLIFSTWVFLCMLSIPTRRSSSSTL
jgi:hypothetical protein